MAVCCGTVGFFRVEAVTTASGTQHVNTGYLNIAPEVLGGCFVFRELDHKGRNLIIWTVVKTALSINTIPKQPPSTSGAIFKYFFKQVHNFFKLKQRCKLSRVGFVSSNVWFVHQGANHEGILERVESLMCECWGCELSRIVDLRQLFQKIWKITKNSDT